MSLQLDKSGWKRVSLGEIAAASKERVDPTDGSVDRFVAGEHMDTDDLKIHRWGDPAEIDLGPAFHRRFRVGQVGFWITPDLLEEGRCRRLRRCVCQYDFRR